MAVAFPRARLPCGVWPFGGSAVGVPATPNTTANRAHARAGSLQPPFAAAAAAVTAAASQSSARVLYATPDLAPGPGPSSLTSAARARRSGVSACRNRNQATRRPILAAAAPPSQGPATAPVRPDVTGPSIEGSAASNGTRPAPPPGAASSSGYSGYSYPAASPASSFPPPPSSFSSVLPPAPPPLTASSSDLRLDLWLSLLQASASQLSAAATQLTAAAEGAATRLQRLSSPPPPAFPAGPPGDQTLPLLTDPLRFLTDATARYGPVVGLLLGGERVALVTGRAEARAVLVEAAGETYVKEGTAFFPGSSLAGNGLLVSDGPVWQRQRRLSNPAFRRAAVEAYAGAMVAATEDMMRGVWGAAGGTRDVYADFNELTLQVTLEALFGFGSAERKQQQDGGGAAAVAAAPSFASSAAASSEDAAQIVSAVEKAFTFFTQRAATGFVIPEWLPTWDNLEFAAAVQQLDRVVYGMINRRRQELAAAFGSVVAAADAAAAAAAAGGGGGSAAGAAAAAGVPSDLLTSLLLARDEDGSGMSDTALRDELMTLLVAGQETSAILLGWASALLAAHPEVQAAAAAEVLAVCGGPDAGPPTPASVRHMPYLESVVLETLRLYSPAYMVGRCARRDAALGPYVLPAGTTVLVSPYVMHRDPEVWEQPEAFRPERWQELQNREGYAGYMGLMSNLGPNGAYLPFGGGPRNCIGTGFAMMEALLVLAAVLQRYSLALPPGGSSSFPKPKPLLTLRPEAVVLRVSPRRA
ncbi:hypothetical protein HYH02_006436 [Chlamydomonas schloesseri]|uniref:Cytochrome P450 n=1 Tax=Chlamydomonas schloesseri TaxID=2026947 RepID=A0A835WKL7_9CHLO|nr:hypothetical protein HYH02_006436 [Chlamydomonas schloesseri]|eukprot:KAG2448545.1 hypothetical protein HYH02_006436 [Chlamydomonas schloesseri]